MAIPQLTDEQLRQARQAATLARRSRAQLKADLRDGKIDFLSALDKCLADEVLAHIRVVDLLRCVPRMGEKRANDLMAKLEIASSRRVRGLGRNQLAALRKEFL